MTARLGFTEATNVGPAPVVMPLYIPEDEAPPPLYQATSAESPTSAPAGPPVQFQTGVRTLPDLDARLMLAAQPGTVGS